MKISSKCRGQIKSAVFESHFSYPFASVRAFRYVCVIYASRPTSVRRSALNRQRVLVGVLQKLCRPRTLRRPLRRAHGARPSARRAPQGTSLMATAARERVERATRAPLVDALVAALGRGTALDAARSATGAANAARARAFVLDALADVSGAEALSTNDRAVAREAADVAEKLDVAGRPRAAAALRHALGAVRDAAADATAAVGGRALRGAAAAEQGERVWGVVSALLALARRPAEPPDGDAVRGAGGRAALAAPPAFGDGGGLGAPEVDDDALAAWRADFDAEDGSASESGGWSSDEGSSAGEGDARRARAPLVMARARATQSMAVRDPRGAGVVASLAAAGAAPAARDDPAPPSPLTAARDDRAPPSPLTAARDDRAPPSPLTAARDDRAPPSPLTFAAALARGALAEAQWAAAQGRAAADVDAASLGGTPLSLRGMPTLVRAAAAPAPPAPAAARVVPEAALVEASLAALAGR
jgi:hypothetical protein